MYKYFKSATLIHHTMSLGCNMDKKIQIMMIFLSSDNAGIKYTEMNSAVQYIIETGVFCWKI